MENDSKLNTTAYGFTIGKEFNGWIVDNVFYEKKQHKRYYYLQSHCRYCNKNKILRADKRNTYVKCNCIKEQEKKLELLWKKIENTNLFNSKEEFYNKYKNEKNLKDLKLYTIRKNYEKEFFLGTKEEYEAELEKRKLITEGKKIIIQGKKCPNCGKYFTSINRCEYCYTIFDELFTLKNEINYENSCYCNESNYLSVKDDYNEKIFIPIDTIKAKYVKNNENVITRIGITRIDRIDYKKQGIIGDFQGVDNTGKSFIIENVFESFGNDSKSFRFIVKNDSETYIVNNVVPMIQENQDYFYLVLKEDSIPYTLYLYKNDEYITNIKHIVCVDSVFVGKNYIEINYEDIKENLFKFSTLTEKIELVNCIRIGNINPEETEYYISERYLRNQKSIPLYINKKYYKSSECLFFYLSKFNKFKRIENEFEDDNTQNYYVEIDSQNFKDLDFIYFLYLKKTDSLTCFGNSFSVYGYPLFRILRKLICKYFFELTEYYKNYFELWNTFNRYKDYNSLNQEAYDFIIKKLLLKYKCDELELVKIMINKYGIVEILNLNYFFAQKRVSGINKKLFLEKENNLIKCNNLNTLLWKSEYTLYDLVKFYYNDAIYQYYIEEMVFDIYVPSINTVFEYQGEEHYKPIELFGGEQEFKERQIRDMKKREFCNKNNIKLIEWKYNELINKIVLDNKLK